MLLYKRCPDGSFVAGDTITGHTAYAYPTSVNARRANAAAAKEMLNRPFNLAQSITKEYDRRNWDRLTETPQQPNC